MSDSADQPSGFELIQIVQPIVPRATEIFGRNVPLGYAGLALARQPQHLHLTFCQ